MAVLSRFFSFVPVLMRRFGGMPDTLHHLPSRYIRAVGGF